MFLPVRILYPSNSLPGEAEKYPSETQPKGKYTNKETLGEESLGGRAGKEESLVSLRFLPAPQSLP